MNKETRVIYKINPLVEVILQIKFPTILTINAKEPADFQEAIRREYPIYQLALENEQEINLSVDNNIIIPAFVQKQELKNHHFISQDGQYKINLTSSFISISTLSYTRWEDLLAHFCTPLKRFLEIYSPSFFERIGIRYIDAFSRETLSIQDKKWCELIQPHLLGALSSITEEHVIDSGVDMEYYLDNGVSRAKIHTQLGNINDNPEKVFIIDSDFFHNGNVVVSELGNILEYLHNNSSKFLKSAITENLHLAMYPEELI